MTSSISSFIDGVLRPFDSTLPSASTIKVSYEAVTSLISFENEANLWEEYVLHSAPLLFQNEAEFRDHAKEIKRAIVLGITDRFDLQNGSELVKADELLALSIAEAEQFRRLSQKQRKSEKDKDSSTGDYKLRLSYLVDLVNKRANSRFHRMVDKYYPEEVAENAMVCTQVVFE